MSSGDWWKTKQKCAVETCRNTTEHVDDFHDGLPCCGDHCREVRELARGIDSELWESR